jgi:hypothetical protein
MKAPISLSAKSERQTYYMVTGEVVFRAKDDENLRMLRINAVVMSKDGRFAVAQIARAQQALQLQFLNRMQDADLEVLDVVILALMPLGEFTAEEFNAAPEGMELRPMQHSSGHA